MPIPLLALLPALAGLGSAALGANASRRNRKFQGKQNQMDRDFQWKVYESQRHDAIVDRDYNNWWNSPEQQMQRYKEAGLNTNLVYGSAGQSEATTVRGSDISGGNQPAPQATDWGRLSQQGIMTYQQVRQGALTAQQIMLQNDLLEKEKLQKDADLAGKLISNSRGQFDYAQAQALNDSVIRQAQLQNQATQVGIEKTKADTLFTLDSNERAKLANSANISKTMEEILNLKMERYKMALEGAKSIEETKEIQARIKQIEVLTQGHKLENIIKDFDAEWRLKNPGVLPSDPAYLRALMAWLQESVPIDPKIYEKQSNSGHGVNSR